MTAPALHWDEGWRDLALCLQVDPGLFYPEKGESSGPAKRVCAGCGVRRQCLEYALANDERHGIWGGLSPKQRHRLQQRRPPRTPRPKPDPALERLAQLGWTSRDVADHLHISLDAARQRLLRARKQAAAPPRPAADTSVDMLPPGRTR